MGGGGGCCICNCCIGNCCVGNAIKEFFSNLFGGGSSGSSSGGRTESYDDKSAELEATIKVQNALTQFREDTRDRSERLENDIIKESRETLDEFLKDVKKYNNIKYGGSRLNVNIGQIERENRKTEDKIHGFIVKRVAKRISLDDNECLEILKLDAGKEKEKRLDEFYKKVLKEAIKDLEEILRDAMEKQTDIVEDHISSRIESIVNTVTNKTNDFNKIQQVKNSDESKMEQEQIKLSHFVTMCDVGLSILSEPVVQVSSNMIAKV